MRANERLNSAGASIAVTCPKCGAPAVAIVSEIVYRNQIRWSCEQFCNNCGHQFASHDCGLAPEPFRAALLANGRYFIRVQPFQEKSKAWQALRKSFNLSISEAKETWTHLLSGRSGTEIEMQYLKIVLGTVGIVVEVTRVEGSG
jgi:hypothetical protein